MVTPTLCIVPLIMVTPTLCIVPLIMVTPTLCTVPLIMVTPTLCTVPFNALRQRQDHDDKYAGGADESQCRGGCIPRWAQHNHRYGPHPGQPGGMSAAQHSLSRAHRHAALTGNIVATAHSHHCSHTIFASYIETSFPLVSRGICVPIFWAQLYDLKLASIYLLVNVGQSHAYRHSFRLPPTPLPLTHTHSNSASNTPPPSPLQHPTSAQMFAAFKGVPAKEVDGEASRMLAEVSRL